MPVSPKTYHFKLPLRGRPDDATFPETWYPGVRDYWPNCTARRTVHPIDGIKAIVIHATAGGSSSGAVSVMREGRASFHWLVPDEDEPQHGKLVWACVPETLAAWHVRAAAAHADVNAGRGGANHWTLGIEVVNTQESGDRFSAWQVAVTAQIVRYCWAKYPNLRDVISHAKLDPQRRSDPGVNFPWTSFKQQVLRSTEPAPFRALVERAARAPQRRSVRGAGGASGVSGGSGCCEG